MDTKILAIKEERKKIKEKLLKKFHFLNEKKIKNYTKIGNDIELVPIAIDLAYILFENLRQVEFAKIFKKEDTIEAMKLIVKEFNIILYIQFYRVENSHLDLLSYKDYEQKAVLRIVEELLKDKAFLDTLSSYH